MGRLTPGRQLLPMGHCARQSLASSQQERVDSVVLGAPGAPRTAPQKSTPPLRTTHSEFSCYVVQLETVSTRAAPRMGNKGIKQGREKGAPARCPNPPARRQEGQCWLCRRAGVWG